MKELLNENIIVLVRNCLSNMDLLVNNKKYEMFDREIRHMELLIKLVEKKINVGMYLKDFNMLFKEQKYDLLNKYNGSISILENSKDETFKMYKESVKFVKILKICCSNIKKYIEKEEYEMIKNEIYYNHNVPTILAVGDLDLIEYYLKIECPEFQKNGQEEQFIHYISQWDEIKADFNLNEKTGIFGMLFSKKKKNFMN